MSEFNRNKTDNFFYQQLINRFFHSHSYFFVCMKYYLENRSLVQTDDTTHQILNNVIGYLTQSQDAVAELKEISKIKGLENTYFSLESRLAHINFRSLQQAQLRTAIQNLALYLLNNLSDLLSEDENLRSVLDAYLKLKIALKQILNEANGKYLHQKVETIYSKNPDMRDDKVVSDKSLDFQKEELTANELDRDDDLKLQNFDSKADLLLKPITKLLLQRNETLAQSLFLEKTHICFYKLQGLAMYTGLHEVAQIAERVKTLVAVIKDNNVQLNEYILELVYRAKSLVLNKAYHQKNNKLLQGLLEDFDQYIALLNDQIFDSRSRLDRDSSLLEPASELSTSEQISAVLNSDRVNQPEVIHYNTIDHAKIIAANLDSQKLESDNNISQIELCAKDEDSIAVLIDGIKSGETGVSRGVIDKIMEIEATTPAPGLPDQQQKSNNGKDDNYLYSAIFSEEAECYYKMILNAIAKLKGEGNAQACLEDIELASYSIKILARKFGMEKISALPEMIELISYQANKRHAIIPLTIVQLFEEGISLLAIFDHHLYDHKIKFTSMLSALKEYYTKTFRSMDIIAAVP